MKDAAQLGGHTLSGVRLSWSRSAFSKSSAPLGGFLLSTCTKISLLGFGVEV